MFLLGSMASLLAGTLISLPLPPKAELDAVESGRALADIVCQSCHLQPQPEAYDKRGWEKYVLPSMALKLGLRRTDVSRLPGGQYLVSAFPEAPVLSSNQWSAISRHWISNAPAQALPQGFRAKIALDLTESFQPVPAPFRLATPMTTLVKILPESRSCLVGDSLRRGLYTVDAEGKQISQLACGLPPVAANLRSDGLYLTLIGYVAPSDDPIGQVLFLPREAKAKERPQVLLDRLPRPTDTQLADLNGDGLEDLVVTHYGNILGRFSWYEKLAEGGYREHVLRNDPGALCSWVRDWNGDGRPDLVVLMAQAQETIYLFTNLGGGEFSESVLLRRPPEWGHTYFELADFNSDGALDFLVVNGDNAEHPSPMKFYHGIRIYLQERPGTFREAFFFPLNGAYKAVARDFDADGDLDIAALSFFPDYLKSPEESFVYLQNEGRLHFKPRSFEGSTSGRWITMDAGDLDGDGDQDIVLGSFSRGPETIPILDSLRPQWTNGPSLLLLKNTLR